MSRGRTKSLTMDEQLAKTISDIEETEARLKELKKTKKELEEQVKANRIAELDELISSSGMSIDEVKELIAKK